MDEHYGDPPGTWGQDFCEYFGEKEEDGGVVDVQFWWDVRG